MLSNFLVGNKTNQGCLRNEIGDSLARLNYNLSLYSSYFIFLNFRIIFFFIGIIFFFIRIFFTSESSSLSQNILQRKVG